MHPSPHCNPEVWVTSTRPLLAGCSSFMWVFTVPYNLLIPCWWGGIPWVCVHTAEVCVPTCCTLHCQSSSRVQAGLFTASDGEGALSGTGRGCDVGTVTLGSATHVLTTAVSTPRCFPLVKNFTLLLYLKVESFFVSKVSLNFSSYCLIQVMIVFLFSTISWWLITIFPLDLINFGQIN